MIVKTFSNLNDSTIYIYEVFWALHVISKHSEIFDASTEQEVLSDPHRRRGHKKHPFLPTVCHRDSLSQTICCFLRLSKALANAEILSRARSRNQS